MRIFFTNAFFPLNRYEGSRVHIEHLARNLIDLGHEVWSTPKSPLSYGKKLSQNRGKRLMQIMRADVFYMRVHDEILIYPRYMIFPWAAAFRKPIVWEINAAPDLRFSISTLDGRRQVEAMERVLRRYAKRATMAICNTDGLVRYAQDLGIMNARRIELGSDPSLFSSQVKPANNIVPNENGLNVVWCGSSSIRWHDFDTIVRSAVRLLEHSKIRIYVIGSLPSKSKVPENIKFLKNVPYTEMPSYMSAMDVGLAIYKEGTWSRYGVFSSPLKLFDYCASGLFVVASPIEQVRRCIVDKKNGFVIPFGDHEALAKCLVYIMKNKSKLEKIRHRARAIIVEHYNWQRVARETVETISTYCRYCDS